MFSLASEVWRKKRSEYHSWVTNSFENNDIKNPQKNPKKEIMWIIYRHPATTERFPLTEATQRWTDVPKLSAHEMTQLEILQIFFQRFLAVIAVVKLLLAKFMQLTTSGTCYGIVYLQKSVTTKQTFLKWSADNKFLLSTAIAGSSFGKETLNTAWIFSCPEEFPSSPSPRKCSVSSTNTEQLLHEQWRESFCRKQIHISSRLTVENAQPHERSTFRDEHPSPACD